MRKLFLIISLFVSLFSIGQTPMKMLVQKASAYDSDAQSYITRVEATGVTLTLTEKNAINTFVVDLKSNSLWTKIYDAGMFIGGTAASHSETLKGVNDITWNGTVTHATTGSVSNGTNGYGDLGFTPSDFTQSNRHIAIYSRTDQNVSGSDMGARESSTASLTALTIRQSGNYIARATGIIEGTGQITVANANSQGFYIASRISTTDFRAFKNGSQVGSTATTSNLGAVVTDNFYIMTQNNNGVIGALTTREYCYWSAGDGLSTAEAATYSTLVNNLQTTLGRNIY